MHVPTRANPKSYIASPATCVLNPQSCALTPAPALSFNPKSYTVALQWARTTRKVAR